MEKAFRYPTIFFCSAVLTGTVYLACQNSATSTVQSEGAMQFVKVSQPDYFETTRAISAEGEKWFLKGLYFLSKRDTIQTKVCYQKALLNGYPVSREYLMPVGL